MFGPVTVGAIVFLKAHLADHVLPAWHAGVKDSKVLSQAKRENLAAHIGEFFTSDVTHGAVWHIDAHNINKTIEKSVYKLTQVLTRQMGYPPAFLIMDGNYKFKFSSENMKKAMPSFHSVVRGDSRCFAISCASILAKVKRDELMQKAQQRFPAYDLAKHKGYGTAAHISKIKELGITRFHRKSFCKKFTEGGSQFKSHNDNSLQGH